MAVRVLALDLERTLISDALGAEPRPGLFDFLTFCLAHFERVVLFTCVAEADAFEVLHALTESDHVPAEFLERLEYVAWSGEHKDLAFIPGATPAEVLLLDDDPNWARPDQRDRLVAVVGWDGGPDDEFTRLRSLLERLL